MPQSEFIVETLKIRLDKYLAENLPGLSRAQIQRDIEAGLVMLNGVKTTSAKTIVRLNDKLEYMPLEVSESSSGLVPTNTPLKILYHDKGLLIIDKPAGLPVHPGAGFRGETLASALLYHFKDIALVGEEGRPGIVHRLDKDTSGVILVATTQEMYEYLKDAFFEHKIKKEYIALVAGNVKKSHGFIETPIGRSKSDFRKYTTKNMVEPKESLTEYNAIERFGSLKDQVDEYTLIKVKLHTGRTHQIRVHFSSIGFPLVGDSLYGNSKTVISGLNRQFLHAKRIEVQLPDGTWIEAESDLPNDLIKILKNLDSKEVESL